MGVTKSDIYSEEINQIAETAKVLGHPARLSIIKYLLEQDTCICNDLVEEIGLAQATISQHLKVLKEIGIIKGNIEKTSMCYCIDTVNWEKLQNMINKIFQWKTSNFC